MICTTVFILHDSDNETETVKDRIQREPQNLIKL